MRVHSPLADSSDRVSPIACTYACVCALPSVPNVDAVAVTANVVYAVAVLFS